MAIRRAIKLILSGFAIISFAALSLILFIYFSVHDDIQIVHVPEFNNQKSIRRLDGTVLPVDSLESAVEKLMTAARVYGLAISVTNQNQTVYQKYFGFKNASRQESFVPGTIFYGASLSKPILADVTLQLAEDGVLTLDSPLFEYLEKPLASYKTNDIQRLLGANLIDYTSLEGDERYKLITARMCLDHTTGFPNWRWLEADKKLKIKYPPGARYSYSGEGMFLLQMVIEELTGETFETLAQDRVFKPLNMSRSSFVWQRAYEGNYCVGHNGSGSSLRIPKSNVANAAGSLSTTLEDYALFLNSLVAQDVSRHKEMIKAQVAIRSRQQFGPNAVLEVQDNDSIQLSYGLGVGIYQTPFGKAFFKEGHLDGWQHYFVAFPEKGFVLLMMANSENAEGIFEELIEIISANKHTPGYWEGYVPYDQKLP